MKRGILMNYIDDCATVLENINSEDNVEIYNENNILVNTIKAKENIPFGHKIAIKNKKNGETIYKYGEPIGKATQNILSGTLIHVHNIRSLSVDIPLAIKKEIIRQMNIKEG